MNDVKNELGISGAISLGQKEVRNLAGISSGSISLNDLKGKSNEPKYIYKIILTIGNKIEGVFDQFGFANIDNSKYGNLYIVPNINICCFYVAYTSSQKKYFSHIILEDLSSPFKNKITVLINNNEYIFEKFVDGMYTTDVPKSLFDYFKSNLNKTVPIYIVKVE